jgi:dihydrofolate reductase
MVESGSISVTGHGARVGNRARIVLDIDIPENCHIEAHEPAEPFHVVAEVTELKDQPGRELQLHGSGALAQTLFDAGLIDTIRLIVFPVVLGLGKRLFAEGRTPSSFRLADVTSTPSGVTMQTLELTGPPEYGEVEVE